MRQPDSRWVLTEGDLIGLTPHRARDLMVECFCFAQRGTIARTRLRLGASHVDDASVRTTVVAAVRLAFRETGGDFEHPTARSLAGAAEVLARKAASWGTPEDVVRHHHGQIIGMLRRLAPAA